MVGGISFRRNPATGVVAATEGILNNTGVKTMVGKSRTAGFIKVALGILEKGVNKDRTFKVSRTNFENIVNPEDVLSVGTASV